ncbi:unnamed protein product [Sphagnum balticum]
MLTVTPCFNGQADMLLHQSLTRRLIIITVGLIVMWSTHLYQTFLLDGFMVQDVGSRRVSTKELALRIDRNELNVVFKRPKQIIEDILG